jgi:hypothetical protein
MNTEQINKEIDKILDQLPDDYLQTVLDYLKSLKQDANVNKILEEDKGLFKRLADS